MPQAVDGQPVYVGLAALVHARAMSDATPFLVGAWLPDLSTIPCLGAVPDSKGSSPLMEGCDFLGTAAPAPAFEAATEARLYWGRLIPTKGPSVLRVHTHDRLASTCAPAILASCEAVLVVDAVVWSGDVWTAAEPLSVAEAVERLTRVGISAEVSLPAPVASAGVHATTLTNQRHLYVTEHAGGCDGPWPNEVFDVRGDPRFGLVAIFPDESARLAAEHTLDPGDAGCQLDPHVKRPGPAAWAGYANVLALVFGDEDLVAKTVTALRTEPAAPAPAIGYPDASLDDSYRVVFDFEAARAAGMLDAATVPASASGDGHAAYVADAYSRFTAGALAYSIAAGDAVSEASVGSAAWQVLAGGAVPGTARLYVVNHPASTDPSLARELLVAFELRDLPVGGGTSSGEWGLLQIPT